jgi:gas vesicle protein
MNKGQWASLGVGVLGGAVAGGVAILLFAPKSGKETRALIKEEVGAKVSNMRHSVGDGISGNGERELVHLAKK